MDTQDNGAMNAAATNAPGGGGYQDNGGGGGQGQGTLLSGEGREARDPGLEEANGAASRTEARQDGVAAEAPDSYEPFRIPEEAANVAADAEAMEGFGTLARELNLSQEQAQKVVEFGARIMHRAVGDGMEALRAQMEEVKQKWHREASEDPVIKADLNYAVRAVRRFDADGEVGKLFDKTGIGSHKAMVRFMIEVGKAIGEAPLYTQGAVAAGGGGDIRSVASSMYEGKM